MLLWRVNLGRISPLYRDGSLFQGMRRPHFLSGVSGNFCSSWTYFISFVFIFLVTTQSISSLNLPWKKTSSVFQTINKEKKRSCPWCNGYRRRIWTRRHEFKSWTWLIAFHIALIPLGKVWIQLFSLQLWVNSRADWFLQPWYGN